MLQMWECVSLHDENILKNFINVTLTVIFDLLTPKSVNVFLFYPPSMNYEVLSPHGENYLNLQELWIDRQTDG